MERDRFTSLIKESVMTLCKNGLLADKVKSVEGLLGITLNSNEVFLVNIKESFALEPFPLTPPNPKPEETQEIKVSSVTRKRKLDEENSNQNSYELKLTQPNQQNIGISNRTQKPLIEDAYDAQSATSHASMPSQEQICDDPIVIEDSEVYTTKSRDKCSIHTRKNIKAEPQSPRWEGAMSGKDGKGEGIKSSRHLGDMEQEHELQVSEESIQQTEFLPHSTLASQLPDFLAKASSLAQHAAASVLAAPLLTPHRPQEDEDLAALYPSHISQTGNPYTIEGETFLGSHTGPWNCFVRNCHYSSKRKYNLERHIRLVHQGIREECQECGRKFSDVTGLRQHRINSHGHQGFECPYCDMVFDYKSLRKEHIQQMHSSKEQEDTQPENKK